MYIIIGASSFIGVYTVDEFLKQGEEVIVTGRKNKFKDHYDELGVRYICGCSWRMGKESNY